MFANSSVSPRSSSPLRVIMIETYGSSCKAERPGDGSSLVKSDRVRDLLLVVPNGISNRSDKASHVQSASHFSSKSHIEDHALLVSSTSFSRYDASLRETGWRRGRLVSALIDRIRSTGLRTLCRRLRNRRSHPLQALRPYPPPPSAKRENPYM